MVGSGAKKCSRDIGKERDGDFSSGLGELMVSVQNPNEHFQEVFGYTNTETLE